MHDAIPNNDYVTQQLAFAIYKAKKPNETIALQKALEVIMTLAPNTSLDLETLGITGAIYKRLYKVNNNFDYLEEAIKMYQRGYTIRNDYYTGENYANCLLFKTKKEGISAEETIYLQFSKDGCSWSEEDRFCVLVKWNDFVENPELYINKAFDKRSSLISAKTKVRP